MNKFNDARQLRIAGINESTEEMCSCNVCEGTLPIFKMQENIFESQQLNEIVCGGWCIAGAIAGIVSTGYGIYDAWTSPYDQGDIDDASQSAYDAGYSDATSGGGGSSKPGGGAGAAQGALQGAGGGNDKPSQAAQDAAAQNIKNAQDAQTLQKLKSAAPYAAAGVGGLALMKALSKKKKKKKKDTAEESYHYNRVVKGK
tara:strand:+ start:1728 stop:2327 length:600 start_codon:yes stop_codon:yes gene_type:complete